MDLKQLETRPAHDAGAEMRVKGPNGKLTDFYIKLAGCDSRLWAKAKLNLERAALEGSEPNVPELMASITLSWRGLKSNKKEVKFSAKVAQKLYENAPYICDQADLFIGTRKNFLMPS